MKVLGFCKICTQEFVVKYFVEDTCGKFNYVKFNISKGGIITKCKYLETDMSRTVIEFEIRYNLINKGYTELSESNDGTCLKFETDAFIVSFPIRNLPGLMN